MRPDPYDPSQLWMLSWGLERFDKDTGRFLAVEGMDTTEVSEIALSPQRLYAATRKGLYVLDRQSGKILQHFSARGTSPTLPSDDLSYIYLDNDGHLWLTVENQGLYRMNTDGSDLRSYGELQGMTATNVEAITADDDGHLWFGSENGIFRYRHDTDRFVLFDRSDQLSSLKINHAAALLVGADSTLFFGTPKGIVSLRYPDVRFPSGPIPVFFSDITLMDGKDTRFVFNTDSVAPLHLAHDQNFFTIRLSRPEYGLSDRGTIYYKMVGFENDWRPLDATGTVSYTNLPPGSYDFKVRYRAADALEDRVSCLQIRIAPPWWRSPLALVIWALMFVGAIYVAFRLYAMRLKTRQKQRQRELEKEIFTRDNEMKLRFFTNISHELRTPLSLIITPLEGMIKREQEPDKREGLMRLRRNAGSLLSLVNQLLDFRRLDMKGEKLTPAFGSLCEFVAAVAQEFDARAAQEGKTLDIEGCKGHEVYTAFDRDKVRKMVNNLLSNAFKFTPKGGTIRVAVVSTPADTSGRGWAKITVADTGCGIPADALPHVFERFYQVEGSTSAGGSGIGLHIVREYARMHQGSVSVESTPGQGTTFTILLPVSGAVAQPHASAQCSELEQQPKATQESQSSPGPQISQTSQTTQTTQDFQESQDSQESEESQEAQGSQSSPTAPPLRKILVVDDNAEFRDFLVGELRGSDFDVSEAADGQEAQEKIPALMPDIVISDVMMPRVDGIELTRWLKGNLNVSHIPVIILTARTASTSMLSGYEAGADEYLSKPFDMDVLLMKIHKLLRQQQQRIDLIERSVEIRPVDVTISSADEKMMKETLESIERNLSNSEYSTDDLARDLLMSRPSMYKKLQALTGKTPAVFIRSIRLKKAALLLRDTSLSVTEISDLVGFGNVKYFNKHFKEEFSMTPSQYRAKDSK